MSGPGVEHHCRDGVGWIEIARPHRKNAVDTAAMDAFAAALAKLSADPDCRVIVIRGRGEAFCSGWDVSEFPALAAQGEAGLSESFARNASVLDALSACPKITVAAVRGPCLGMGFSLLARCDVSLSSDKALFGLPELRHGVVPGMVMEDAIAVLGARRAADWILSYRDQDAHAALTAGLVGEVVADDAFEARLNDLTARLAKLPVGAVTEAKGLIRSLTLNGAGRPEAIAASVRSVLSLMPQGRG